MTTEESPVPRNPPCTGAPLRVLMVCTANLCRSPMMEFLFRDELTRRAIDWQVSSAGTRARPGLPAYPHTIKVLGEYGFDLTDWRSTPLSTQLLQSSDLVITAAEEHRSWVLEMSPASMGTVYPLRQLAHILDTVGGPAPVDADTSLVEWVANARTRVQPVPAGSIDLEDPIGRSLRHFRRCRGLVDEAVRQIVAPLVPLRSVT